MFMNRRRQKESRGEQSRGEESRAEERREEIGLISECIRRRDELKMKLKK
jgi:hypothetical protein